MPKKFYLFIIFISIIFGLFIYRVIYLSYYKHDYYVEKYEALANIYVTGTSAPRGRILDINGNVLVDNIGINSIFYHEPSNITFEKKIEVAKRLVQLTNYSYAYDENKLKDYYILIYSEESDNLITSEEKEQYNERKLTSDDLTELKKDRITAEMLDELTDLEKYSSYFYYLMIDGYSYDNKCLLHDVSDEVYASIIEANLLGVFGEIEWSRTYPYEDTLRSVFGTVSDNLPSEKIDYLKQGYSITDKVGTSGLEEYYEEYLKGEKAVYKVENNNLVLIKEAKRGNDVVLQIDIELQLEVESILKEEILNAKKLANTKHFKESYALISEPSTGAIKAIGAIRLLDNGEFQDISINVIKNAYTVGSVVKGASISVGYQNGAIDIGTTYTDSCVKLANLPAKCSYKSLGTLNDIHALAQSSNYYQFMIALKIAGYNYKYNMKATATQANFDTYRNTFKEYGLGTLTGIDLPNETEGLQGQTVAIDLLLNLAIGQYDLYTPVSLLQYINTIANNGTRLKLNLMHSIKNEDEVILENKVTKLNQVNLEEKYFKRIQQGFREVMQSGTGYWYINPKIQAAGKTGTSESYIDTNYDGTLDTYVISNTFIMYAPYDNPQYSIVVISPNVSNLEDNSTYRTPVNRLIARDINDFLFSTS